MNLNKIRISANSLAHLLKRGLVINSCLVLAFYYLLIFGHSQSLSSSHAAIQFAIHSNHTLHSSPNQSDGLPIESHQTPEVPDEVEANDNLDDSSNKLDSKHISVAIEKVRSGRSLLLLLKHSVEARERVSLFILHHCWRSFLV